jgi:hypothetical protein
MLLLIKAQLKYIIHNLYHSIIIIIGISSYAYIREFNSLNLLCLLLFVQFVTLVLLNNAKENRDITIRLLVLSPKQVAISRIVLVSVGFVIIYFISFVLHVFFFNDTLGFRNSIHELFMFGGIALCGIFLYLAISDYFSVFKGKSSFIWFNVIVSFVITLLSFFVIITISNSYNSGIETSSLLISGLYIISIILGIVTFISYQYRESYLGYK